MDTRFTCWTFFALAALSAFACRPESDGDMQLPYDSQVDTDAQVSNSVDAGMAPQHPSKSPCSTPPTFDQVAAFDKCVMCHAATRSGAQRAAAPADINFDSEAAAASRAARAAYVVMAGFMPPRESGLTLTKEERQQLYDWAMCRM
jgi:uncharacterized membrane protein